MNTDKLNREVERYFKLINIEMENYGIYELNQHNIESLEALFREYQKLLQTQQQRMKKLEAKYEASTGRRKK